MSNKLFIGIDPAFRRNGFSMSIIDLSDKTVYFKTFKDGFLDFCGWFLHESPEVALFCVENSNKTKATFWTHKDAKTKTLLTGSQARNNRRAIKLSINEVAKISRGVGKNMASSQYVVDLLKTKYPVVNLSPKEKGAKWLKHTTAAAVMRAEGLTPNKKTTNQDDRDALKLALIAKQRPYLAENLLKRG